MGCPSTNHLGLLYMLLHTSKCSNLGDLPADEGLALSYVGRPRPVLDARRQYWRKNGGRTALDRRITGGSWVFHSVASSHLQADQARLNDQGPASFPDLAQIREE